ncbi:MAG: serine hydrolase [Acidobacteriota bacterium]
MRLLFLSLGIAAALACVPAAEEAPADETPVAAATDDEYPLGSLETWLQRPYLTRQLRSVETLFPTRAVAAADAPSTLVRSDAPLEIAYRFDGAEHGLADFPERTDTTGLLILQGGEILHEEYFKGSDETTRFLSMSVAKSFTSTLLGIARGDGLIESFDDPADKYLPQLAGSGYEGVSIKDILQMSSGVDFSEVYADEESDIAALGAACFGGGGVRDLAMSYGRKREPGTVFEYSSVDTLILGMLLQEVTGQSVASYMEEKVWQPIGAESDAAWVLDQEGDEGFECTLGGLNVTLRDYARFGLLMAQDGVWNGERILPEGWVAEATIPDAPHVQPGKLSEGYKMGYQYQWWTFPDDDKSFTGEGIHGQLLMVNPVLDLVMVKTSDWELAWDDNKEAESWALWDAVQEWVRANRGVS